MANKQVKVRSLVRHPSVWDKQWGPTDDDSMGKQIVMLNLVLPAETDANGKPKGDPETITVYANGNVGTVGETSALTVPPHINEWCRLLVANHFSGDTDKGRGYSRSVVLNLAEYEKDTIEPLIKRGAVIEAVFGKRQKRVCATFEQLFTEAVIQAAMLKSTDERWPEAVAKEVKKAEAAPPPVEVAFSL